MPDPAPLQMTRAGLIPWIAIALAACGGNSDPGVCVWNQAYQENFSEDSVDDILAGASSCYVLIDPFGSEAARNAISEMQVSGNTVGCYISSGTCEDWRDDYAQLQAHCVDTAWGLWEGEYFVDAPDDALLDVMKARIDAMAGWGCDMVEFDNMDWAFDEAYRVEYGFAATPDDAIAYNQALCDYTQQQGMGCMAKNTREGAEGFDGGTFESYSDEQDWWEHDHLAGFLEAGGLGIVVHYDEADCEGVHASYVERYGVGVSFICEDRATESYRHFPAQ